MNAPLARKLYLALPITAGVLILAMLGLSAYEIWVMNFGPDVPASSLIVPDAGNLPPQDARGAFLQLDPAANKRYATTLIGLLETETPGVVTPEQAPHLLPSELQAVVVRQAAIADSGDYRVYPLAADTYPMTVEKLPNGVVARIYPTDGVWQPGNYIVDIPANGTFGGREYYAFVVDPAK